MFFSCTPNFVVGTAPNICNFTQHESINFTFYNLSLMDQTTYVSNVLDVDRDFVELIRFKFGSVRQQINPARLSLVTIQYHVQLGIRVQHLSKAKTNCHEDKDKNVYIYK